MKLSIVGIYKHDFASCPEELRQLQPGDMVWLQKEPENTYDPMAVRASVMGRFLGYAASVSRHELHAIMGQEDIIEASFCSLDEEHKGIEVERTYSFRYQLPTQTNIAFTLWTKLFNFC